MRSLSETEARRDHAAASPWRATLAGLCASLVGIGFARFAFTPLLPALIEAEWFAPSQAVYLGAANLAGYLAGALLARAMARCASTPVVPLVLDRIPELVQRDRDRQTAAWSLATGAFALGQAAAAYGFSFLFALGGGYELLFALGAGSVALALAIDLAVAGRSRRAAVERRVRVLDGAA